MTDREVVEQAYRLYAAGDLGSVFALMAEDIAWGSCGIPGSDITAGCSTGRAAVDRYFDALRGAWEIEGYEVREILGTEGRFAVHARVKARHKTSGTLLETDKVDLLTIRDGRIAAFTEIMDTHPMHALAG